MINVGLLTISDRASAGTYDDLTGPALSDALERGLECEITERAVISDDFDAIADTLVQWVDTAGLDLILTNGGTGLSPRDVTPEATRSVLDSEAPGFGELMRLRSLEKTIMASLSRATGGRRGRCVIVNLPGSPKGAVECLGFLQPILVHAVDQAKGSHHS